MDKLSRDEELRALPQRLLQIADDLDTVDESTVQQEVRALATHAAAILTRHDAQGEAVAFTEEAAIDLMRDLVGAGRNGRPLAPIATEYLAYLHPAPTSKRDPIGKTVSVDMSTNDASAEHRIFGKVIGVQDDGDTLLCEFVEQNYPSKREAVVTQYMLDAARLVAHNVSAGTAEMIYKAMHAAALTAALAAKEAGPLGKPDDYTYSEPETLEQLKDRANGK